MENYVTSLNKPLSVPSFSDAVLHVPVHIDVVFLAVSAILLAVLLPAPVCREKILSDMWKYFFLIQHCTNSIRNLCKVSQFQ